jgi:hypothetical protein
MRCALILALGSLLSIPTTADAQGILFRRSRAPAYQSYTVCQAPVAPCGHTAPAPAAPPPTSLIDTFFPPAAELTRVDPPLPALAPGERPITILVPLAPKALVARTLVTWGFKDATGAPVAGGRDVFDSQGGVSTGVIPAGVDVNTLEIHARVDYVEPQFADLEYLVTPTIGVSGVNALVQTSANVQEQRLIFRTFRPIHAGDYLVARFHTIASSGDASQEQQASTVIEAEDLRHAERATLQKLVSIPTRVEDGAKVQWKLHGRIQGAQVSKEFIVEHRNAVEVFMNTSGQLDVWLGIP